MYQFPLDITALNFHQWSQLSVYGYIVHPDHAQVLQVYALASSLSGTAQVFSAGPFLGE